MFDIILQFLPYAVIVVNAVVGILTYRRTGKVSMLKKGSTVLDEDLQALIDFHLNSAKELQKRIGKK